MNDYQRNLVGRVASGFLTQAMQVSPAVVIMGARQTEAYSVNRTKRLIKAPKLYWSDPGLASHLASIAHPSGSALENLILLDVLAWRETQIPRPEILYWRTTNGLEVDLVILTDRGLLPVEVKAGARPSWNDSKGLRAFLAEYPDRCSGGILLHTGDEVQWIADGVLALPMTKLF